MEATQKSYKEYVFYDSLKKGLIKECLNPNGKEFRNYEKLPEILKIIDDATELTDPATF